MYLKNLSEDYENDIAVIGFAGKLPGADSIDEFWEKIKNGEEFLKSKEPDTVKEKNDSYIYKKTSIDDAYLFDREFWNFTPSEAKVMDPQHRLFMECAWEAIESSGYNVDSFDGTIGLFAGCSNSTYLLNVILKNRNSLQDMSDLQILIGNEKDYMVSQTAYKMNLKGPCIATQTACSSSLTAVHTACDYLLSGQCDMAIVGGVTIKFPQENKYMHQPDGLVSSDGYIHTFDDQASGTVYSNGVGVAVLKRLKDAIEDKDYIYSVIRGSSINNDGSERIGFTAPGMNGQTSVIEETLQVTNINPESISLVEAHGTGTVIGDAIEFQALKRVYESYTDRKGFCALGSVKTNIGHVEMAAGIFTLLKTSLALKNKLLPASLHFDTPNRDLEIADSPFYINTTLTDWESDGSPRRAAVSSFGLGGTNVHMILEEAINDTIPDDVERKASDVFVLSAKKQSILIEYCKNVADAIEKGKHRIEDIVYTLKVGRKLFEERCVIPFHSELELVMKLRELKDEYLVNGGDKYTLMFGYTGSTSFRDDEIKQLYSYYKYIQQYMDLCMQAYNRIYGECFDLDSVLVKASMSVKAFICEYSIAKNFIRNGAEPEAVIVDGTGMLSAMAVAEVISVDVCMRWLELGESGAAAYFIEDSIHMFSLNDGHRLTYNDLLYLNTNEVQEGDLTNSNLQDVFGEIDTTLLCLDSMGIVDLKSNEKYKLSRTLPVDLWVEQQLGVLWGLGNSIHWEQSYENCYARRVPIPTYPFQKEMYWIEESNESEYNIAPASSIDVSEIVNNRYLLCDYLRNIWESYIGVKNVGIKDSFFGLGGQSIIAMQILSKIRKDFEVDIPLRNFLQNPTIINLSEMIEEQCKSRTVQMSSQVQTIIPQIKVDLEHRYEPFELTDIQRAYWVGKAMGLELGNISTHIYTELDTKPMDINRLSAAFNLLIQRHEMLRGVVLEDGNQVILENVPYYEFKNYPYDKMNENNHLQFIRNEMSHQVFNSAQWPLFDIRISDLEYGHRLHISFDLLIMDAWSMEILMDELSFLYLNPEAQLEEIQCSYRDYVKACLSIRKSEAYSKSKDYWCNRINTLYGPPMFHLAKEPNFVSKPHFKRYQKILEPKTWNQIKQFSAQLNVTASAVLLTLYSEVLARWSSEPQFTINLTLFNRLPIHEQINQIIGDFTSLTLLEVDASKQITFYEKVKNVQNQLWMDMDYRYFSGLEVERELSKVTNNTNKALMPVVFTSLLDLVKSYDNNLEEPLITSIPYSVSQTPQVWLDHQVIERDGVLFLNFDFIEEIFFDNMINDMFDAYYQYICELADGIEIWNRKIEFSTLESKLQPLTARHKKNKTYEIKTLNYMVSEQCIKTPNADAIITDTLHITYQQLEKSANVIASYLTDRGVKTGELVAVIMEKGWEQLVSVLGILKAGAAYLPIDATLPKHRMEELLAMTESRFILTNGKCVFYTEQMTQNFFEVTEHLLYQEYVGNSYHFDDMHGEAYVIFTSGSTGIPKGVRISHENAANTILDMNERLMISENDRILALSSLSFDLSVYDIFGILSAGGTVVVPSSQSVRNPQVILNYILEHGITIWNTVPAIMELLVNYLKTKGEIRMPSLRAVLLSGDYIPVQLPDAVRIYADNAQIYSLGGATEGSIWSIIYPIKEVNQSWKTIPYGLSLTNQSMVVLNKKQELCPVYVKGGLYITGTGVAQGYWKNEEETQKRFLWIEELGERAYRTGDVGYYLPDGTISFIGREDNQVKLNGFRIELGEVESILMKHPNVEQAAAVFHKQQNKIYAYVVLKDKKADCVYENNIITDHVKRLEFKLTEINLRNDGFEETIPLVRSNSGQYYRRRSYRHFKNSVLSLQQFSNLISCLAQDNSKTQLGYPKYMYASSGGLYPVQTYVAVKAGRIENVKEGLYYFNPQRHDFNRITNYNPIESAMFAEQNQLIYEEAGFVIFLIGYAPRIVPMYGEKAGLQFMSIEAGLMSQLLEMTAADEHIGLCQIGSFRYDLLNSYLNTVDECVGLHCLMGGEIEEDQMTKKGFVDEQMEFQNKLRQKASESEALDTDFHRFLKEYIPAYMMPANIMILKQLPLTLNGKVDRNVLVQFSQVTEQCESRSEYKAPSNEVEAAIAEIWSDLFGGKKVGVCDNFFECGGDSFLLIKAYNRINKVYPDRIILMDLFQYPTIQMIAEKISDNTINSNDDENQMKKEESRLENRMKRLEQMRSRKRSDE